MKDYPNLTPSDDEFVSATPGLRRKWQVRIVQLRQWFSGFCRRHEKRLIMFVPLVGILLLTLFAYQVIARKTLNRRQDQYRHTVTIGRNRKIVYAIP